jgi:DNA-binding NarL/FixJ family response regulator
MVTHLSAEQRQLALRLRARGLSLRQIGPQVGCSHELVGTREAARAAARRRSGRRGDPDLVAAALETGSSPLTPREADVLRAAADGISTEQIGTVLRLPPTTIRNYTSNAITKVGARNRIDAIRIARNAGWI